VLIPVCWGNRFAYTILAGEQLVAITNAIKFRYDDGKTHLIWQTGVDVDNAVWITVFLVLVIIFNMFPVRVRSKLATSVLRKGLLTPRVL
jgi:Amino acid transporters